MRSRCKIGNTSYVKDCYVNRGVTVCQEWATSYEAFRDWALANGYAETLEIDRERNDQGYSPGNCRWVTHKQNMRNTRRNVMLEAFGRRQCLTAWAEEMGIDREIVRARIRLGWPVELAVTSKARRAKLSTLLRSTG